ncbi:DUF3422 family protein [Orrella daihaiensis]|uniref:DUF3422 domain-containing protein n=1 Tax=Orrella daihaiensis TaxID=2782176 RepID=A0ABY4ALX5_9BURK|nr:DUF3422 domain-containing protein [Orrella daihaiensis]UOD51272.1 DUF3422 domain-containing protein [Orrella daihaiensis]
MSTSVTALPMEHPDRHRLHDEIHARPVGQAPHPVVVFCLAVLNEGVSRDSELAHLAKLNAQTDTAGTTGNFARVRLPVGDIKWERHTEFTRYTMVLPIAQEAVSQRSAVMWFAQVRAAQEPYAKWFSEAPGQTIAAIEVTVLESLDDVLEQGNEVGRAWFGESTLLMSRLGTQGHSLVLTDFRVQNDGVERMLVLTPSYTSPARIGRTAHRLIEMEIYRLMALKGLPVAKSLGAQLSEAENALATIAREVESTTSQDPELLHDLASLAATIERANADHNYRFSATAAYHDIVLQRIKELRESPVPGIQTVGEFIERRLGPAMATVAATAKRLDSLSERVSRVSDLLRTRVNIMTEQQNQQLLEKLTRGQALQLKLQQTVEGLSIAAISYYVVSLIYYLAKAGKTAGWLPFSPDVVAGLSIAPTVLVVWQIVRRIHRKISHD